MACKHARAIPHMTYKNTCALLARLLYTKPENFFGCGGCSSDMFHQLTEQGHVGLLAIDEVHLIYSWKNFRYVHMYRTHGWT